MVMTREAVVATARDLFAQQTSERSQLDIVRRYWTNKQALPAIIPAAAPREVKVMARVARVNVIKIVIESITQSLIVTGIRTADQREDEAAARAWAIWQANAMDRRQSGLVRATTAYGTGYGVALPGVPEPVMRPVGPRQMTTMYDSDDDVWPVLALWRISAKRYRLLDNEAVYELGVNDAGELDAVGAGDAFFAAHGGVDGGRPVCPVVRFRDAEDLDLEDEAEPGLQQISMIDDMCQVVAGQVAPLMDLQDQINLTSFSLKAAEWYSAFRQRWIIGRAVKGQEKMEAAASQLWAFDEEPDRMSIGEFNQTELRGYLDSRAEAAKFAATLSQTPVHELIGELVNLSAEALAAAEIGRDRMISERKIGQGEAHEQWLRLACGYAGVDLPTDVQMDYADTSARAFGAVVDGLGKIAQMLQVPPQELWERIPGATKQDVERWRKAFEAGDSIAQMNAMLDRQANPGGQPGGERTSPGGIILPPGVGA